MGGSKSSSNASRLRKRVEAESSAPAQSSSPALKRAKDGSAFAKCDECKKDVPVALISFHNCILDAKIKTSLEAQVVEMPCEPKKTVTEKRKPKSTEPKLKKLKKANNQNTRKRPPTAFFLFMEDFRITFKESNPDCKKVSTVAKEGGEKWKSMSDEEKKVYVDRAAELKAEYEKAVDVDNVEGDDVVDVDAGDDDEKKDVKDDVDGDDKKNLEDDVDGDDKKSLEDDVDGGVDKKTLEDDVDGVDKNLEDDIGDDASEIKVKRKMLVEDDEDE